jgi:hypothetical protein
MLNAQTPIRAIRQMCLDCAGGPSAVRECQGDTLSDGRCPFYAYRMGKGRPSVRLIRKHCLQCMGGSPKLVRECPSATTCPLYSYRLGTNPKRVGVRRGFSTRIKEKTGRDSRVRVA